MWEFLFCVSGDSQATELREQLRAKKRATDRDIAVIDAVLASCGTASRSGDVFGKNSLASKLVSATTSAVKARSGDFHRRGHARLVYSGC